LLSDKHLQLSLRNCGRNCGRSYSAGPDCEV